jgi:hypothetical protein
MRKYADNGMILAKEPSENYMEVRTLSSWALIQFLLHRYYQLRKLSMTGPTVQWHMTHIQLQGVREKSSCALPTAHPFKFQSGTVVTRVLTLFHRRFSEVILRIGCLGECTAVSEWKWREVVCGCTVRQASCMRVSGGQQRPKKVSI